MKYLIYIMLMIFSFILQTTFIQHIAIDGIMPNLILFLVICVAFMQGESDGLFLGIIGGLLHDCFYGQYIGSNLFLYAIIGYIVGIVCRSLYKDNFLVSVVTSVVATLGYEFFFFVLNVLLKGATNLPFFIVNKIIPSMIYNGIFSFIVYLLYRVIYNYFLYRGSKYTNRMF